MARGDDPATDVVVPDALPEFLHLDQRIAHAASLFSSRPAQRPSPSPSCPSPNQERHRPQQDRAVGTAPRRVRSLKLSQRRGIEPIVVQPNYLTWRTRSGPTPPGGARR